MSDVPRHRLELKVPPPLVALLAGLLMWSLARTTPHAVMPAALRGALVGLPAILGSALIIIGALAFRSARTTVHPEDPEKTSALVTGGVYRVSRNPMYLGLLLVLIGWVMRLAAPAAALGPVLFVLYISRFQIAPEERILRAKFGAAYGQYTATVRRWV